MQTMDAAAAAEAFAAHFSGVALRPEDAEYERVRSIWNGAVDRRPAVIARCAGVDDIVLAVRLAVQHGLTIAVRAGGHSVAGLSTCDSGVMIDLSPMRGVEIDPDARIAHVQPGATWADVDAAAHQHGLATTGGLISTTGVAGLTLGGGIGWLQRKHGLACDNLLAAEVVTASGELVRTTSSENPELFWGLRGGGGNFGIAAGFEFRLSPVATVVGGLVLFPLDRGRDVLRGYREWAAAQPDEFTTLAAVLTAPPAPFVPADLAGSKVVAILGCWCGDAAGAEAALRPLRALSPAADVFGPMPYPALQGMLDAGAPHGLRNYFRAGYVADLSDGVIDVALQHGAQMPSPMSQIHFHQMGGAVARVGEDDTAFSNRRAGYAFNVISTWTDAGGDTLHEQANRACAAALQPFSTGGVYVNFLGDEGDARVRAAYGDAKFRRLAELKRHYDPGNVFHRNQNIPPASA